MRYSATDSLNVKIIVFYSILFQLKLKQFSSCSILRYVLTDIYNTLVEVRDMNDAWYNREINNRRVGFKLYLPAPTALNLSFKEKLCHKVHFHSIEYS